MGVSSLRLFVLCYDFQIFHNETYASLRNKSKLVCFALTKMMAPLAPCLSPRALSTAHLHP